MSGSHIAGNRNSTPETSHTSLRPPSSRASAIGSGHALRASADMGAMTATPLMNRGIRPSSEVYFNQAQQTQGGNAEDAMERAAQQWIADIDQYEITLEEMAAATLDQDFKDELSAIEQWFRVLSEAERTAALYALLQQTTQVQIRFFIQVLQQMAKSHPMSGVLSPANFGEKGTKLNVEGSRNSVGLGRPPPSPGAGKRNSGLDPSTINSMFPDAAAAIAKQKAEFTQHTGTAPPSNRNSAVGDRSSLAAPSISAPQDDGGHRKENVPQPPSSPWGPRSTGGSGVTQDRPKSAQSTPAHQQPMGQFTQPPPSAGLPRSPRPMQLQGDGGNVQSTTLNAPDNGMPMLSPYSGSGNWASMVNTPMVGNFSPNGQQGGQQGGQGGQGGHSQAEMVANATAMKLAALSTVNNRIQLDDVRKYRRARSSEGNAQGQVGAAPGPQQGQQQQGQPMSSPSNANFLMTNELGHVLTPQQAAALQAQQLAAMNGRRSRPNSPGMAMQSGGQSQAGPMGSFASPQNNGFLAAYDGSNPLMGGNNLAAAAAAGINLSQFGLGGGLAPPGHHPHAGSAEGYLSDHSATGGPHQRGRSPRGGARRGSSKPPEDPTDPGLLQDIPAWLRSLRLHKYTDNLKDLKWTELVELDDEGLERRGVNALGARRKMLKVFEQVKEARTEGRL
ncbi:hypothetical protein BDY21DRAFT_384777 [Lineolata rhizophorae]|uniref:RNA-binding protein VTS1 n=1 Tax=Lineolata rhizophorae TaxID=578093 RepID=A0A6A6P6P4_9PEZI|nr:hypothetical protein BDY21DRAFT_384777 [Lineolata rhizophorae]